MFSKFVANWKLLKLLLALLVLVQDVAMEDVVPTGVAALGALNRVVSPLCLVLGLGTWHGKLGLKVL